MQYINTSRLILRDWQESDIQSFAKLNADPKVMEFFLKLLNEEESYELYVRIVNELNLFKYGLYAVELKESGDFIGFTGFHNIAFDVDFAPGVEIGWRLAGNV